MSKLVDSMMGSAVGLPSARAFDPNAPRKPMMPVTSPGLAGQLAGARTKIQELEQRLSTDKDVRVLLSSIVANPWQPRRRFKTESLADLASSIKELGVMQPVLVRSHPTQPGVYELVAGERRLRASHQANVLDIPIRRVELSDQEMAVWALSENLNREDLTDYEKSRGVRSIVDSYEGDQVRAEILAPAIGLSRSQFYRFLTYDVLPQDIHDSLAENPDLLSATYAEQIASLIKKDSLSESKLLSTWAAYKQQSFTQAELIARLRRVDNPATERPHPDPVVFSRNGKRVGRWTDDGKTLTIALKTTALSTDKQEKLRKFVETLLQK